MRKERKKKKKKKYEIGKLCNQSFSVVSSSSPSGSAPHTLLFKSSEPSVLQTSVLFILMNFVRLFPQAGMDDYNYSLLFLFSNIISSKFYQGLWIKLPTQPGLPATSELFHNRKTNFYLI